MIRCWTWRGDGHCRVVGVVEGWFSALGCGCCKGVHAMCGLVLSGKENGGHGLNLGDND